MVNLPQIWSNVKDKKKIFISHLDQHRDIAVEIKNIIENFSVSAFVSHVDIPHHVDWEQEIVKALHCMDYFVALHTIGFKHSPWTQQEVGFALGRGIKIISVKIFEDPAGFLNKKRAIIWNPNKSDPRELICELLKPMGILTEQSLKEEA